MAASRGRSWIWSRGCSRPSTNSGFFSALMEPDRTTMPEDRDFDDRRFYGRRKGRPLRKGQQQLIDTLLPRLAIALPEAGKLDPKVAVSAQSGAGLARDRVRRRRASGGAGARQPRRRPDRLRSLPQRHRDAVGAGRGKRQRQRAALPRGCARSARCAAGWVARPGVPAVPRPLAQAAPCRPALHPDSPISTCSPA